jgi:hypothetical protein
MTNQTKTLTALQSRYFSREIDTPQYLEALDEWHRQQRTKTRKQVMYYGSAVAGGIGVTTWIFPEMITGAFILLLVIIVIAGIKKRSHHT